MACNKSAYQQVARPVSEIFMEFGATFVIEFGLADLRAEAVARFSTPRGGPVGWAVA